MKAVIFTFISFMLIQSTCFAGSGWFFQNSGTTSNLQTAYFVSSSTGWIAGEGGTILKTTNGGDLWVSQTSGISSTLNSICFSSSSIGYAAGINGIILKTTNGGTNWTVLTSGTSEYLLSICFANSLTGWVVGSNGIILKTSNGGINWNPQVSGTSDLLFSVDFKSSSEGWAVGGGTLSSVILKTTNGGANWSGQIDEYGVGLQSVHFANTTTGCTVGLFGSLFFTTDGGGSWYNPNWQHISGLRSVFLISPATGWMTSGGLVYKILNGGTLIKQETNNPNLLNDICFTSDDTGWVVGYNGTIMKTTNSGTSSFNFNLSVLLEGFYEPSTGLMRGDTITTSIIYTSFQFPENVFPARGYLDSAGHCSLTFYNADNSSAFYIILTHRNSILTFSGSTISFSSYNLNYDFTTMASKAYGDNMKLKGTKYCIYGGDVNQDAIVDLTDAAIIDNDMLNFAFGYLPSDVNGDNAVDLSDAALTDNNAFNHVMSITPYD